VILVSLRDLQFRRRRFVVGIVGTSVVLALTLILAGVSSSFLNEVRRTTEAFNAASWVVPAGATGPFLSSATLPASLADELEAATGSSAAPVALMRGSLPIDGKKTDVNLIGVPPGSFADPPVVEGRAPQRSGEIVVDNLLSTEIGEELAINGRPVVVVGRTDGLSYAAGVPSAYVPLADAQEIGYRGAPLATVIVTSKPLTDVPEGYVALDNAGVKKDLLEPVAQARQTINMVLGILWLVAAMIIGSIVYLSSLDRVRDFAVFKAMGATDRSLLSGVVIQALLLSGGAYAIGAVLSRLLGPMLPMQAEISGLTYVVLVGVAIIVAGASSLAGVRRALTVDPALAFGGA
jgi:putative ABC transport system permease protein